MKNLSDRNTLNVPLKHLDTLLVVSSNRLYYGKRNTKLTIIVVVLSVERSNRCSVILRQTSGKLLLQLKENVRKQVSRKSYFYRISGPCTRKVDPKDVITAHTLKENHQFRTKMTISVISDQIKSMGGFFFTDISASTLKITT